MSAPLTPTIELEDVHDGHDLPYFWQTSYHRTSCTGGGSGIRPGPSRLDDCFDDDEEEELGDGDGAWLPAELSGMDGGLGSDNDDEHVEDSHVHPGRPGSSLSAAEAHSADDEDDEDEGDEGAPRGKGGGKRGQKRKRKPAPQEKQAYATSFVALLVRFMGKPDAKGHAVRLRAVSAENYNELAAKQESLYGIFQWLVDPEWLPACGGKFGFQKVLATHVGKPSLKLLNGIMYANLLEIRVELDTLKKVHEELAPALKPEHSSAIRRDGHAFRQTFLTKLKTLITNCTYKPSSSQGGANNSSRSGGSSSSGGGSERIERPASGLGAGRPSGGRTRSPSMQHEYAADDDEADDDDAADAADAADSGSRRADDEAARGRTTAPSVAPPSAAVRATNDAECCRVFDLLFELLPETFEEGEEIDEEVARSVLVLLQRTVNERLVEAEPLQHVEGAQLSARKEQWLRLAVKKPGLLKAMLKEESERANAAWARFR